MDSIVPKVSVTEPRICDWTSNSVIALIRGNRHGAGSRRRLVDYRLKCRISLRIL
jgi:hypothetical protein